ncbi:STAS domain-containing protein [Streptomyces sp. HNM0645]|uniref:STAS domain-containing protein n=1 Tax=Streptomyces sp. HNM0645 TaxID=2782343 RepID=UPI0024B6CB51|nr:STAS domain-containing protein [Streptomyces sp. HNM0645]MDI9885528.1 STAS domain-containing protein [Streptomyces sp. HNM0645]
MHERDHTPSAPDTALGVLSCGRRGNAWVVTLGGDLGPDALAGVSRQLDDVAGEGRAIVVDTKSVTSADPAMLTLLMKLQEEASLYVAAPSPPVRELLESAGPRTSVRTVTSLGEALDALGAGPS